MVWRKLVEREGDFLKNYLLYENLANNFPQVFDKHHSDLLTIRIQDTFAHYLDAETTKQFSDYILLKLNADPSFFDRIISEGKEFFEQLLTMCRSLPSLESLEHQQIETYLEQYFEAYKRPYPHFNMTVFFDYIHPLQLSSEVINKIAAWRFASRDYFNQAHALVEPLFQETSKRLNISVKKFKFLTPIEIKDFLLHSDPHQQEKIRKIIENRQRCYFHFKEGNFTLHENASYIFDEQLQEAEHKSELKGIGLLPGVYTGNVVIVKNKNDLSKITENSIIVTSMTTPDLSSAILKKAKAIVTDEGGITCHAVVVSKECNVPVLVGTKCATKVFKDGDVVEVDTKQGIVRRVSS